MILASCLSNYQCVTVLKRYKIVFFISSNLNELKLNFCVFYPFQKNKIQWKTINLRATSKKKTAYEHMDLEKRHIKKRSKLVCFSCQNDSHGFWKHISITIHWNSLYFVRWQFSGFLKSPDISKISLRIKNYDANENLQRINNKNCCWIKISTQKLKWSLKKSMYCSNSPSSEYI